MSQHRRNQQQIPAKHSIKTYSANYALSPCNTTGQSGSTNTAIQPATLPVQIATVVTAAATPTNKNNILPASPSYTKTSPTSPLSTEYITTIPGTRSDCVIQYTYSVRVWNRFGKTPRICMVDVGRFAYRRRRGRTFFMRLLFWRWGMSCRLLLRVVCLNPFSSLFGPLVETDIWAMTEHDHIIGVSISIRFNTDLISVWNKLGSNERSVKILEQTIVNRLSPELRPADKNSASSSSYFYKRHADHEGFREAVETARSSEEDWWPIFWGCEWYVTLVLCLYVYEIEFNVYYSQVAFNRTS